MKKIIILSIVFLSLLGFTSCTQDEIDTFKENDNIYFSPAVYKYVTINGGVGILTDSTGINFGWDSPTITKRVYRIPIRVQGNLSNVDRVVKLTVDPSTTAIEGTHYSLPKNIVMRAGKQVDTVDVTVFRTPDMKTKRFTLVLNLEDNDQFSTKMKSTIVDPLTKKTMSYIRFKLSFDDILAQPAGWYAGYYGTFSLKKFYLMVDLMHLDAAIFIPSFSSPQGTPVSDMQFFNLFMRRYLADQKASGNTVYEADGTTEMTFPVI